jgi:hypothetical protein
MTNIRLRIEGADPAMIPGYFGVALFTRAASIERRTSLNRKFSVGNGRARGERR